LIVRSTPIAVAITPSANVWAKAVASGIDSIIVYVVNDNYVNASDGKCYVTDVPNATVKVTLPSWMVGGPTGTVPTAFEITAGGLKSVSMQLTNGNQLQLNLGTLTLTRMIVLTTDPQLRTTIQQRYDSQVRPGVCAFAPELCVTYPPSFEQQPSSQSVIAGGTVNFTLTAVGTTPLFYRWQKNQTNLYDGGHYSGCTTSTLTIASASLSDVANYRCVVTNAYGSTNSATATLTLAVYDPCLGVTNVDFESGFALAGGGYLGANWNEWETDAGVIVGYDEPAIVRSGAHAQRLRVSGGTNGSSGGAYQRVPVFAGQPFTASVWTYAGDNATACYLGVDPAGGTNPISGVTWSTANTNAAWVQKTVTGTATAGYLTVYLKVASSDSTKRNGYFDDAISVECADAPPRITQQPTDTGVLVGGTAGFTALATGSKPLSYRWQKDSVNLNDGGHHSGSTTPMLIISSADTNDMGSYRCVVTNVYGSTNSSPATLTVTNAVIPPGITQQPFNQSVAAGGMASFTVGATGSDPLSYQWQKSVADGPPSNLNNGGHYSGVLTPTLAINAADNNDVANYRCVVTNVYGSTNSSAATLTVIVPNPCIRILNAGFEDGFLLAGGGYLGTNWTEWETVPGVVNGYDETGIVHGGTHSQRLRVSSTGATSGGVYQRVPVTNGNPYAVSVWIYADTALTSCYLGVDPAGGIPQGGTNSASVIWSSATTNVAWIQKSWVGTATANYLTVFYKVATPDNVKRNGYFDDATPSGSGGPPQLLAQRNGNDLKLLWPECPAAHLELATTLTPPLSWTTVTNPVTVTGGQKSLTITPTCNSGYYRLVLE
jgi:hypothetical protein